MTVKFIDNFTNSGADVALSSWPSSGAPDWERIDGGLTFNVLAATDRVRQDAAANDDTCYRIINAEAPTGAQEITADLYHDGGDHKTFALCVRCSANGNYYMAVVVNSSTIQLYRFDNGTSVQLGANFSRTNTTGAVIPCRFRAVNNGAQVDLEFQAGTSAVCTFSDTAANRKTTGTSGLWSYYNNDSATFYVDNVVVDDLAAAGAVLESTLLGNCSISAALATQISLAAATAATTTTNASLNVGVMTYTSSFDATENPISGWVNGGAVGLDWHNVQSAGGNAHGTMNGGADYTDSIAHLSGFAPNHEISAIIRLDAAQIPSWNTSHEFELCLRFAITAHNARGYEFILGYSGTNWDWQAVRWNGTLGSFQVLTPTYKYPNSITPADGDELRARIVGNELKFWLNSQLLIITTDASYNTGEPGIGFYNKQAGDDLDFGFKSVAATDIAAASFSHAVAAQAAIAAALATAISFAAAADSATTISATLSGPAAELAGAITGNASTNAALSSAIACATTTTATAAIQVDLATQIILQCATAATTGIAASLESTGPELSVTLAATGALSAELSTAIAYTATITAMSGAQAVLQTAIALQGSGGGSMIINAAMTEPATIYQVIKLQLSDPQVVL